MRESPTPDLLDTLARIQTDLGSLIAPVATILDVEGAYLRCLVVELAQVHADLVAAAKED